MRRKENEWNFINLQHTNRKSNKNAFHQQWKILSDRDCDSRLCMAQQVQLAVPKRCFPSLAALSLSFLFHDGALGWVLLAFPGAAQVFKLKTFFKASLLWVTCNTSIQICDSLIYIPCSVL